MQLTTTQRDDSLLPDSVSQTRQVLQHATAQHCIVGQHIISHCEVTIMVHRAPSPRRSLSLEEHEQPGKRERSSKRRLVHRVTVHLHETEHTCGPSSCGRQPPTPLVDEAHLLICFDRAKAAKASHEGA